MIKVEQWKNTDPDPRTYKITASADTKAEVENASLADYIGLPSDASKLELMSSVMTTEGHLAFMRSDGNWNWVG